VTTLRLPSPHNLTHGKRNPIAEWLDGLGLFGLHSCEKFVPPEIFAMHAVVLQGILVRPELS